MEEHEVSDPRISLLRTGDGSITLHDRELDESYHSSSGALGESRHVFIERGLLPLYPSGKEELRVLEIGFGTGINALLTLREAHREKAPILYESIEPYPLGPKVWQKLAEQFDDADAFKKLHEAPWEKPFELSPYFRLLKRKLHLEEMEEGPGVDLIYYDAFGAKVRSDLWESPLLDRVLQRGKKGSVFVTYAAKGGLKRSLASNGWKVEVLKGAWDKREMTRAWKVKEE